MNDPRIIHLTADDNIAVAAQPLTPGDVVVVEDQAVELADPIPVGHKLAIRPIAPGEKVLKYGAPIGSATQAIQPGQYVHTHNLRSDYLPTFTLDGANPYLT